MRVTTAGRYALRAMLDLALNGQSGPVLRQEITSRQEISSEYIAQLFRPLTRAGLAKSVMGPGGGYQLARSPEQITISQILSAVEGPFAAVHCVLPSQTDGETCSRLDTCAARVLWTRLTAVIVAYLDTVTLQDMCVLSLQLKDQSMSACPDPISSLLESFPESPTCPLEFAI